MKNKSKILLSLVLSSSMLMSCQNVQNSTSSSSNRLQVFLTHKKPTNEIIIADAIAITAIIIRFIYYPF